MPSTTRWVRLGVEHDRVPRWVDLATGNMLMLDGKHLMWLPPRGQWITMSENCTEDDVTELLEDVRRLP